MKIRVHEGAAEFPCLSQEGPEGFLTAYYDTAEDRTGRKV